MNGKMKRMNEKMKRDYCKQLMNVKMKRDEWEYEKNERE
jgi:hypothetical protein